MPKSGGSDEARPADPHRPLGVSVATPVAVDPPSYDDNPEEAEECDGASRKQEPLEEKEPPATKTQQCLEDKDKITREDLEAENWVWVETEIQGKQLLVQEKAAVARIDPGFFHDWPSFGVCNKLAVVTKASGAAFCFGFVMGARAAMDSLYRLLERPFVASGLGLAAALTSFLQPTVVLTAVEYLILGGVVGGAAVATPVFVVGTGGVFVSAAVYHSFEAAKRGAVRAVRAALASPVRMAAAALPPPPEKPTDNKKKEQQ